VASLPIKISAFSVAASMRCSTGRACGIRNPPTPAQAINQQAFVCQDCLRRPRPPSASSKDSVASVKKRAHHRHFGWLAGPASADHPAPLSQLRGARPRTPNFVACKRPAPLPQPSRYSRKLHSSNSKDAS
jgi:hypothetical protein